MSSERTAAVERRSPGAAFGLLSSDSRISILQALGEAGDSMSFSALREAVGEPDSGKFNYHLKQLSGHFVAKDEDGYRLSLAGRQMYGAILSGAYTADASVEPFEFDGPCPTCGNDGLVAAYADEMATLSCPECDSWHNEFTFPPGNVDQYERAELPAAFDRWMYATVTKVVRGFCANCGGRVDGRLDAADPGDPSAVRARYDCDRCDDSLTASPLLPALFDPVSVGFFHRLGVDVYEDPSWRYVGPDVDRTVEVTGEDPLTVTVTLSAAEEDLVAVVGPDVSIDVTVR